VNRRSLGDAVLAVAVWTALLAVMAAAGRSAYATVPVTVDGTKVTVPRGTHVAEIVAEYSAARAGDLVSATDRRVIVPGAGEPVTALVNGGPVEGAAVVSGGETVCAIPGTDTVEPVVVETMTVEPPVRTVGEGPLATIVSGGAPGVERMSRGAVSGDVVSRERVAEPKPAVVRRTPLPNGRVVALTFDDGPWPQHTAQVLEILADKDVPATFFMVGYRVKRAPDVVRAVRNGGHALGNHSFWHRYLDTVSQERLVWEIAATNDAIEAAAGVRPTWFRAPAGRLDDRVPNALAEAGMRSALWTVDPQDWRSDATAEAIVARVMAEVRPGAVVVLHDGGGDRSETVRALPALIDRLRAEGYGFVTLDELGDAVKGSW